MPAADIAQYVGEGTVDMGITGYDNVLESEMAEKTVELLRLGFGKCRLCVQVPDQSIMKRPQQLLGKRLVTSFPRLTRSYFDKLLQQSDDDNSTTTTTTINFVSGSVEAAIHLGLADGIVDLVESGETMRAARLHSIATVVESEAVLLANPRSTHQEMIDKLSNRLRGIVMANRHCLIKYNVERSRLQEATQITPGNRAPTLSPLVDQEWVAVESMVVKDRIVEIMDRLELCGARDILVLQIQNSR